MFPNSERHYDLSLLRPHLGTSLICLPSLAESIAADNPQSHNREYSENGIQVSNRSYVQRSRYFRICRRLKRLISKKSTPANIRSFTSESIVCNIHSTSSEDVARRSCCFSPRLSYFREFFSSLSKSLSRYTGRRMPNENLFVLSMIQLLCGLAAVVLSGVAVTKVVFLYQMATGLWSGFLMLATGFHGILTARRCTPRTLVSLLIFCVLVALSACLLSCVSVAGLIEDGVLRPETSISLLPPSNSPYYFSSHSSSVPSSGLPVEMPLGGFSHRHLVAANHPPRLHQVMLHVLLLVIGILEASVSAACAVLCCRQICPSDSSPPLAAISYLQNRAATLVPGGSEFLLAVAAEPGRPAPVLLDYALPRPNLHPSTHNFLPRPGRRVVILTQAETGVHALAAAQAVANVVSPCTSQTSFQTSSSHRAQKREESQQLRAHLSTLLPRLASASTDSAFRAAHPSNLLYVLSSPCPTVAPMIFPPFPPAYCAEGDGEEARECPTNLAPPPQIPLRIHPQVFNSGPLLAPEAMTLRHNIRRRGRRIGRRPRELPTGRNFRGSRRGRPHCALDTVVGLMGDRILQPVLVIEDEVEAGSRNADNVSPPSYSVSTSQVNGTSPERR